MALPTYHLYPTNRNAEDIVEHLLPQMDADPEYQRDHVWTVEQRRELIKSWIMGVPTGVVIINNRWNPGWRRTTGEDVVKRQDGKLWALIDGKQRVETARWWFQDMLPVPADWFPAEHVERTLDFGVYPHAKKFVKFSGLCRPAQRKQGMWPMPVVEATLPSPQAEAELFLLVNGGGTGQEPEVMERARKLAGR